MPAKAASEVRPLAARIRRTAAADRHEMIQAVVKQAESHQFGSVVPILHLTKVAFACRDLDALQRRIAGRALDGEVRVPTRMRPKRSAELVGGNLYWIVKHRLIACQQILRFDDRTDGRIDIVCAADLVAVPPTPRRAHQGWRYLEGEDAPGEGEDGSGLGALPPRLYGKLASLALV